MMPQEEEEASSGASLNVGISGGLGSQTASLLDFHREMLSRALEDDCLMVCAKGLGHQVIITKLVQLYCQRVDHARAVQAKRVPLVFVVNASDQAEALQRAVVERGGAESRCSPPIVVTNKLTSGARRSLYLEGGCFVVTSRIMVVDLLSGVVDLDRVTGVLVDGAHKVTDKSNAGFILNILRASSSFTGFVKAFSDAPEALSAKFGFLAQVMSTLGVNKLHLWPRFHLSVRTELDKHRPIVADFGQPLTDLMAAIQRELVTLLEMCLKELRKTQNLDVSGLTVENGLFRSFEVTLRRQLDPLWHKVGRKTKQLVYDVGVLRRLLPDLLRLDAVTFLRVLDGIREEVSGNQAPSLWLLTDAADRMFRYARTRVLRTPKLKTKRSAQDLAEVDPLSLLVTTVLDETGQQQTKLKIDVEENPKFGLLRHVLDEIRAMLKDKPTHPLQVAAGGAEVVIFCHDELTARDIRGRLRERDVKEVHDRRLETYLRLRFRKWCSANGCKLLLEDSVSVNTLKSVLTALYRGPRAGTKSNLGSAGQNCDPSAPEREATSSTLAAESDEAGSVSFLAASKASTETRLLLSEHVRRLLKYKTEVVDLLKEEYGEEEGAQGRSSRGKTSKTTFKQESAVWSPRAQVMVFPIQGGDGASELLDILEQNRPRVVVMFEPDVEAVRTVELFEASRARAHSSQVAREPIQMYFLQYQDSVEEQRYLSDLKREQDTFRKLIDEKAGLVIASASQGRFGENKNATALQDDILTQSKTIVGYNVSTGEPIFASQMNRPRNTKAPVVPRIIVDMREFRSALPSLLHKSGIHVEPATLEVGDYILAPEICIERKSIPDLHGSFNSGRLFTQAEAMCKYYKRPNLLIEFDEDKPFSLQAVTDISTEISHSNILSKMVLLTTHFPDLRLLWSPSPHATVDLFKLMKTNYDNPDVATAVGIGMPDNVDGTVPSSSIADELSKGPGGGSSSASSIMQLTATLTVPMPEATGQKLPQNQQEGNISAQEVLRRLPGISVHNVGKVLSNVRNLRELSMMSVDELAPLIGRINAVQLFKFFNQEPDDADGETFMANVPVAVD